MRYGFAVWHVAAGFQATKSLQLGSCRRAPVRPRLPDKRGIGLIWSPWLIDHDLQAKFLSEVFDDLGAIRKTLLRRAAFFPSFDSLLKEHAEYVMLSLR